MDDNTLVQMLGDLNKSVGAVSAQVGEVNQHVLYLRDSVDEIKRTNADHETRIAVLEDRQKGRRFRLQTLAAWFGATVGSAGLTWEIASALWGHK